MERKSARTMSFVVATMLLIIGCTDDPKPKKEIFFDHLHRSQPIDLVIEGDLSSLIEDQKDSTRRVRIQLDDSCATVHEFDVRLSLRGVTRKAFCDFPPLKLDLKKSWMPKDFRFDKYRSYKLVTHCKSDSGFADYLRREYLVYKLLNTLTDNSFRVIWTTINYQDDQQHFSQQNAGFIIEDNDELAARLNGRALDDDEGVQRVSKKNYQLVTLFQFMIGNTDWSLSRKHNMEYVETETGEMIPVPYDFDYAGLVNAHYAVPHPQLPIKKITDRLLQFRGKHTSELAETVAYFLSKQDDIVKTVDEVATHLGISADYPQQYIDEFFTTISSDTLLQSAFTKYQ